MCDKAKWSFPVLRSGVVLRTRERAPSCSVVCGPEEDSWTRSLTVSLLNGPLFPLAKWSRRAADQRSRGRAECGRGRVPTGGVDRALSEGTFRRLKRDRRSLQGCRTRTAGQSGDRPAARGSPGRPRGPGRRASAGGPSEASQSRRLWRRQRGRALPTLSADDSSVNSTSVETHLQLKTTPRSARRTRGGGALGEPPRRNPDGLVRFQTSHRGWRDRERARPKRRCGRNAPRPCGGPPRARLVALTAFLGETASPRERVRLLPASRGWTTEREDLLESNMFSFL